VKHTGTQHRRAARATARAFALLAAVAVAAPATAQQEGPRIEFTVRPAHPGTDERSAAWLIRTEKPGAHVHDTVVVQNLGTLPVDLILYPSDAQTTPEGDFTVEPEEGDDDGVASWIALDVLEVSLEPDEYETIPVHITVPENASPGDHAGGIVARTKHPLEGGPLPSHIAVAARLYLTVDGPRVYDLRLTDLRAETRDDGVHFFIDMYNAGNMLVEVGGDYDVRGPLGLGGGDGTIDSPATLIPGSTATKEVVWDGKAVLGGRHTATFHLAYTDGHTQAAAISFFLTPPPMVLVIAGLLALALLALVATPILRRVTL